MVLTCLSLVTNDAEIFSCKVFLKTNLLLLFFKNRILFKCGRLKNSPLVSSKELTSLPGVLGLLKGWIPREAVIYWQLCPLPPDQEEAWPLIYFHRAQLTRFWRFPTAVLLSFSHYSVWPLKWECCPLEWLLHFYPQTGLPEQTASVGSKEP